MNPHTDKQQVQSPSIKRQTSSSAAHTKRQILGSEASFQFMDNRPETLAQRKLHDMATTYADQQQLPIQKKTNTTGLPDQLKLGIENLSGYNMDDVKVHYNSNKPAQLQAHAYAHGSDIHLAPGQDKHLPHEAWHVVQQKQGRVKPTVQLKGKVNINDDVALEKEADVMGAKARTNIASPNEFSLEQTNKHTISTSKPNSGRIFQRTILTEATNFEFHGILTMEEGRGKAAELEVSNATKKMQRLTGMAVAKLTSGNKVNTNEKVIIIAHREKSSFTRWPATKLVEILIQQHGVIDGMEIELLGCNTAGEKVADVLETEFIAKGYTNMKITGYPNIMVVGDKGPVSIDHGLATEWWKVKAAVVKDFEEKVGLCIYETFNTYIETLGDEDIKSYSEFLNEDAKKKIKTQGRYINAKTMKIEILRRAKQAFLKGKIIDNAQNYLWDLQGALEQIHPKFIEKIEDFLLIHTAGIIEIQEKYEQAVTQEEDALPDTIIPIETLKKFDQ